MAKGMDIGCCCYLIVKSCLTLCDPMDCSPPGFSVRGIFQVRILECCHFLLWENLPDPEMEPESPTLAGGFFTV